MGTASDACSMTSKRIRPPRCILSTYCVLPRPARGRCAALCVGSCVGGKLRPRDAERTRHLLAIALCADQRLRANCETRYGSSRAPTSSGEAHLPPAGSADVKLRTFHAIETRTKTAGRRAPAGPRRFRLAFPGLQRPAADGQAGRRQRRSQRVLFASAAGLTLAVQAVPAASSAGYRSRRDRIETRSSLAVHRA